MEIFNMAKNLLILFSVFTFIKCSNFQKQDLSKTNNIKVTKLEMHLSAFGVESDSFPTIDAKIDLIKDTSYCIKSFYNPNIASSSYKLTKNDLEKILAILSNYKLDSLQNHYEKKATDQPRSTTIIYTDKGNYSFDDYGLIGNYPLQELYKIVYLF